MLSRRTIYAVGERVNNPKLTDEQVSGWSRMWNEHPVRAMLITEAMVRGPSRARLDRLVSVGRVFNILPPDNSCGTWDSDLAKRQSLIVKTWLFEGQHDVGGLLLLGKRVGSLFELGEFGLIDSVSGVPAMCVPHPSGRSRFWNKPGSHVQVRSWCVDFEKVVKSGGCPPPTGAITVEQE